MRSLGLAVMVALLPAGVAAPADDEEVPLARIEKIVVDDQDRLEAAESEVRIVRARTGDVAPARRAMALFEDDQVATGANASLVLLFEGNAPEEEKKATVGAGTQLRIRSKTSLFLILGRILSNVRGLFEVERPEGVLGARGTEFEVLASDDGATRLLVLEGTVQVAGKGAPAAPLAPPPSAPGMRASVAAGGAGGAPVSFAINNGCQQEHTYEIRAPDTLAWVSLVGERFVVNPGEKRTVPLQLKLDAARVGPGVYRGDVIVKCLDCDREPGCSIVTEPIPLEITVTGPGGAPSAAAVATAAPAPGLVHRLEETELRPGEPAEVRPATESAVRRTLDWSSNVLLTGRPAYTRPESPLYFPSVAERDRTFKEARFRAVWTQAADGYESLGNIYCDWGEGAKGLEAYQRAGSADPSRPASPDYIAGVAEAYRLKGRLEDAETRVRQALSLDPRHALALVTLGNLRLDQADAARDRGENDRARERLDAAVRAFDDAAKAEGSREKLAVSHADRGRAYLALGDLDREEGRADAAREDFEKAERAFRSAQDINPPYPYSSPGLADAYRGHGHVALARGERERALGYFRQSQEQYLRAIQDGRAPFAALTGLGTLYEELGRDDRAQDAYRRAVELKPDEPRAYWRLGMLIAKTDPHRAAPYLRTYLNLEAPVFEQGRRARQAEGVVKGEPPPPPQARIPSVEGMLLAEAERTLVQAGYVLGTIEKRPSGRPPGTVLDQQPDPGQPARARSPVNLVVAGVLVADVGVPDVEGDKEESAIRDVEERGLKPRVVREAACEKLGRVRRQDPRKGARVPNGTVVTLVVASAGDNPASVPQVEKLPRERAEGLLRRSRLNVGKVRTRQTSATDPGTVVDQDPEAGKELARDCPVNLTVAEAVPLVDVPDFRGMSEKDALGRLSFLGGLVSHLTKGEVKGAGSGGVVYDQNPKPGSRVPPGTAIDLWIRGEGGDRGERGGGRTDPARQLDLVTVPDVRNYPLNSAIEKIRSVGLSPRSRSQGGCVEGQSPAAGARVPRNTTVTLDPGLCPIR
jgi:beta-lactam-binding protein with PASTA domain/tetratricopeptide (TPR) repeat protein